MNSVFQHKSLLIVDPNTEIESVLRRAYDAEQLSIYRTGSGHEALRRVAELKPDLIVSDFHTQDLDGRSVFNAILENKELKPYQPIPFVLISDEPPRKLYGSELFLLGLMGWYVKPINPHEIREIFKNMLWLHEVFQKNQMLKQEVKKSEYRYRDLLENADDFIFTLDQEGKLVYINNRFKPLTGYEKEEWLGKSILLIIDPLDRKAAFDHCEMAHQGRARVFESRILNKTSEPMVLSISLTPIVEKGKIVGAMGIGRDVVEQKRMEKEILDLKNFNESIIESMQGGLLTIDLDRKITSLNTGGQNILGWKAEEVLGKPLKSVLRPEEVDVLLFRPSGSKNLLSRRETELTLKSGKRASIGFTVTNRIDNRRKKVGTIISFRDISLLKQMQTEVIRMDRLASLGVLASGIAHEIKNPLAGIKTLAQACDEEFESEDPRREYLSRIIRQVNRLDDLLQTFFAYAKPKPPDKRPHPLHDILKEVGPLVFKKMEEADIHFFLEIPPNLSKVMVDAQQMQQVFLNLILNAIEAMPTGGVLKIIAADVKSALEGIIHKNPNGEKTESLSFVEIQITDTGMGIPSEKLETIFDPFFTTKSNGVGLGLSIVYRIIEEHQGDIRVDSTPHQGTKFYIYLPTGEIA
jgi:PAS domain S-box-containing protein